MEMDTDLVLDIDEIEDESEQETRTYAIDFVNGRISGFIDGMEALKQAITKILITERYKNLIYSDYYGNEVKDAISNGDVSDSYIESEIPELIKDALSDEERILEIDNFIITADEDETDTLVVSFDVISIYGDFSMEEVI